jgi:hypothetical protein
MNSKNNPNFNKVIHKTAHAEYLNAMSLMKLGQIDEKEMSKEL